MIPEISASKVAGLIGLHKYQNADEIAYELIAKDPAGKAKIAEIEREEELRPFYRVLNEVLREGPIQDIVANGVRSAQTTSDVSSVLAEVELQAALALDLRRDTFPPELKARLAEEIRGQVSKKRGLQNEEGILNQYEVQKEVKVTERNTRTIKKDFGTFKLIGRCDGYVAAQNRIVDSKDRTRVWPQVPLYDEIQLRCYMAMYGATESELIERFPNGDVRHTIFPAEEEKWASIESALRRAVDKINSALTNDEELKRIIAANGVKTHNGGRHYKASAPRVESQAAAGNV